MAKTAKKTPAASLLQKGLLLTLKAIQVRADYFVAGLGNPGSKYENTRHNVGFLAIDELYRRHGAGGKKTKAGPNKRGLNKREPNLKVLKGQIQISEVVIGGRVVVLAKPQTYMNLSGNALKLLKRKYKIADLSRLFIVHDELDLVPGEVRLKMGGSSAGHKGIQSAINALKSQDFWRIRIGIGKPPTKEKGADYVLAKVREPEIKEAISLAADIFEDAVSKDAAAPE